MITRMDMNLDVQPEGEEVSTCAFSVFWNLNKYSEDKVKEIMQQNLLEITTGDYTKIPDELFVIPKEDGDRLQRWIPTLG